MPVPSATTPRVALPSYGTGSGRHIRIICIPAPVAENNLQKRRRKKTHAVN